MRFSWRAALGIVLSAVLLWYAFHKVPWSEALEHLRHAKIGLLALSAVAATGIFPLRARRWRTILDPVERNIPFAPLWHATAIGMMINNVVPVRFGEIARAYVLTRERKTVPFSTAFASLAVDRLFDSIVVLGLLFVGMMAPSFPAGGLGGGSIVGRIAVFGLAAVLVALAGLYVFAFFPDRIIRVFELLARRVAPRFEERGGAILRAFAGGLGVLRSPRRFAAVLWWALLHWLLNAFAFWIAFRAVNIEAGYPVALFLQGIIASSVAIPSVPGFFGPFEAAAQVALGVYAIDRASVATWAVSFHVLSFIPITVIGAVYFARLGLTMDELRRAGRGDSPIAEENE